MQMLKDSVRDRITTSAKRLFSKRGFRETSVRMIATDAGITVGNIYRYFDTKEQILDYVLQPVIEYVQQLICQHNTEQHLSKMDDHRSYHEFVARSMVDIFENYQEEYRILIRQTHGTAYEDYYENLVAQISATMIEFSKNPLLKMRRMDPLLYRVIARNNVDAILHILEHAESAAQKEAYIRQYLDIHQDMICKCNQEGLF